jgi:hypothetical protein
VDEFVDAIAMMFGVARLGSTYVLINGDTTHYAAGHVMRDCAGSGARGSSPDRFLLGQRPRSRGG